MADLEDRLQADVPGQLEREFMIIREAVTMVAAGHTERVVLASLSFATELLDAARRVAVDASVQVTPLWSIDDTCHSIAIERIPQEAVRPSA